MVKKPQSAENNLPDEEILCGFHGVQSSVARAPASVVEVLLDENRRDPRMQKLRQQLAQGKINFRAVSQDELKQWSHGVRHQGVIARVLPQTFADMDQLLDQLAHNNRQALLLILDQVQDPHNLGACLRTADGAGVDAVILPKDGACPVNATVARVAAGAVGRLPVFYVPNLARTMDSLQKRGIWITGGDDAAQRTLYEMDFTTDTAIVMGAEGKGLRRLTGECCDQLARIPMSGSVSSLNVSVATGLFLFEVVRQRAR